MGNIGVRSFPKKILVVTSIVLITTVGLFYFATKLNTPEEVINKKAFVKIGEISISVEIADTDIERAKGLSNRESLNEQEGMLFIFPKESLHKFWMKDMHFSLDIVWINEGRVVDITHNVPPQKEKDNLAIYQPKEKIRYVLEVNSGFAKQNKIDIGVSVKSEVFKGEITD